MTQWYTTVDGIANIPLDLYSWEAFRARLLAFFSTSYPHVMVKTNAAVGGMIFISSSSKSNYCDITPILIFGES